MARRDALLKLHKRLVDRRTALARMFKGEMDDLSGVNAQSGDAADVAFESGREELASQLAELESRELQRIDSAIIKLEKGTYGVCEGCQERIPVARLNFLPYCSHCIACQKAMELSPRAFAEAKQTWDRVRDSEDSDRSNMRFRDLVAQHLPS